MDGTKHPVFSPTWMKLYTPNLTPDVNKEHKFPPLKAEPIIT
jgi:hypothetical protein